jgi:hypothetical protein
LCGDGELVATDAKDRPLPQFPEQTVGRTLSLAERYARGHCRKVRSEGGEPGHRSEPFAVKVGDPTDPRAGGPSGESRLAHRIVGVARHDGPVFEHWLIVVGRKELKAKVCVA